MKREQATLLLTELVSRAAGATWPASLVQSVHVFGSYARGAPNPGDVDIAVTFGLQREQIRSDIFVT